MSAAHREQIEELLDELPEENILALLGVLRRLGKRERIRRWSSAVATISDADAEEMRRAVAEGCERVDPGGW